MRHAGGAIWWAAVAVALAGRTAAIAWPEPSPTPTGFMAMGAAFSLKPTDAPRLPADFPGAPQELRRQLGTDIVPLNWCGYIGGNTREYIWVESTTMGGNTDTPYCAAYTFASGTANFNCATASGLTQSVAFVSTGSASGSGTVTSAGPEVVTTSTQSLKSGSSTSSGVAAKGSGTAIGPSASRNVTSKATVTASSATSFASASQSMNLSAGTIVGVALGGLAFVAILTATVVACLVLARRSRRRRQLQSTDLKTDYASDPWAVPVKHEYDNLPSGQPLADPASMRNLATSPAPPARAVLPDARPNMMAPAGTSATLPGPASSGLGIVGATSHPGASSTTAQYVGPPGEAEHYQVIGANMDPGHGFYSMPGQAY
ncbi:MAG: hypothetical protein M1838_001947 [Thelocarpon superellum]|nr:MAG: hypothetical protein M1838_001947 [Thelocarpon superellum]